MKTNKIVISRVIPDSIAEEMGVEAGDKLLSINDKKVKDIIDYKYLITEEILEVDIEKVNGEIWTLDIEKDYDEDLGLEFERGIIDKAQRCSNNCIFCFIDQLPPDMRETLYFKDDDSRLSFLQGNFVTLTNMKEEDLNRIIEYKISPINVSVHTTNAELRVKMLNNRFAGDIFEKLKKLAEGGIFINCQIVLCPGINDKNELEKTVMDLYTLYPQVQNVAVVPVGITKYREGLFHMKSFDYQSASSEIQCMDKYQNKFISEIGEPFVRLSDEFYVIAEKEIPGANFYGKFDQLEDGVGMIRMLRDNIDSSLDSLKASNSGDFLLATGDLAYEELANIAKLIVDKNPKLDIKAVKVLNEFFGHSITVSGLITGQDIYNTLKDICNNKTVIIPSNMLRERVDVFLDDMTVKELEEKLKTRVLICDYTGEDLIELINQYSKEASI